MYTLGLDIGSSAIKALVLRDDDIAGYGGMAATVGVKGADEVLGEVLASAGIEIELIDAITVTGYGRDSWAGQGTKVSELSCHALGARRLFPDARTVIDIGGQDFKVIALNEAGRMSHFQMNDKCAAGTGRFLDVMRTALQLSWEEFSDLALQAREPSAISNTCTVFAESEVISQLAAGKAAADVAAGVFDSVAQRVAALVRRVGLVEDVVLTGGAVRNEALRVALERALDCPLCYSPLSYYCGALGAALSAQKQST